MRSGWTQVSFIGGRMMTKKCRIGSSVSYMPSGRGGVAWAASWDAPAIAGLAESLSEINYHSLREAFEQAVAQRTIPLAPDAAEGNYAGMDEDLATALSDLTKAIEGITLGSIEHVVITAAGEELIRNWNDHDPRTRIDEAAELERWLKLREN